MGNQISLWHQNHPSDSLDLLELPQGPALFTECLEWRLPRADQTAFRAAWANLVASLFGWRELRLTATLWSWWQDTHQPRLAPLQLLAALLAESPERLPLPLRSRSFAEPCPEEVALAAEAQQLDNRLPPGPPARQLYAALRDQHTRPSPTPRKSTERWWRGRGRPPPGAWRR